MSETRKKISMNKGWRFYPDDIVGKLKKNHAEIYGFTKAGGVDFARIDFDDTEWEEVNLPHDFIVGRDFDENAISDQGYKQRGICIYRKNFQLDESDKDKRLLIEFGGIATYSTIYFNGSVLERNWDGYNEFAVDITDRAIFGDVPNIITVRVDAESFQGWWYEGGGIYRDVWLYKKSKLSIARGGVFVNPVKTDGEKWTTNIETCVENDNDNALEFKLVSKLLDKNGLRVKETETTAFCEGRADINVKQEIDISGPELWDIDTPTLYTLRSEMYIDSELIDETETRFGYRTIKICPNKGFYLNGRPLKIKGTCNHQDHAGIGIAMTKPIIEYRIKRLKEMGSNAYRTAHGNSWLVKEVCDELGMLVMEENRVFESSKESLARLEEMVKTSRNHPSVVIYCIFNEEDLQATPMGRKMAKRMMSTIKRLDNTRPITAAMNGGLFAEEGVSEILDIAGFNYQIYTIESYHEKHPEQPIIATENNCALSTRGVYKTNPEKNYFNSYDKETVIWGNLGRETFDLVGKNDYIMGYFVWTGFDYRGEPTPCKWPSINSHWGILDTCGFAKDSFYLHKAMWTDEPMVHIVPSHWNFKSDELQENGIIKVMSHTNCEECELILNGKTLGRKETPIYEAEWDVEYEPGVLEMIGYKGNKEVARDIIKTAGEPYELKLELTKQSLKSDTIDCMPVNVCAVDKEGNFVPYADHNVTFELIGGEILGVGNGNPTSHERDKANHRKLWNGRCQAIIGGISPSDEKSVKLIAKAEGLISAQVDIPIETTPLPECFSSVNFRFINKWSMTTRLYDERPDPDMEVDVTDMNTWERIELGFGPQKLFEGNKGFAVYRTEFELNDEQQHILHFHSVAGTAEIFANGRQVLEPTNLYYGMPTEVTVERDKHGKVNVVMILYGEGIGGIAKTVVLK